MKIVFAGGGTGGHIYPSLSIAKKINGDFLFLISRNYLDKKILEESELPFKQIFSGKFRRYFSFLNFLDFFKFLLGIFQSLWILAKFKPDKVFCKGGFVSLPVAIAAWILGFQVILHESDSVPGLANRLTEKFAKKIIFGIKEGNPIAYDGEKLKNKKELNLPEKEILFVTGGSQGAQQLNNLILESFEKLKERFFVVHCTGKGKKTSLKNKNYLQFEFLKEDYFSYLTNSDLVVSRAGAGSISEILFFQKKSILVPLDSSASDHQRENAKFFAEKNLAKFLEPKNLNTKKFLEAIFSDFSQIEKNLKELKKENPAEKIAKILEN